jgi:hypothetical protein
LYVYEIVQETFIQVRNRINLLIIILLSGDTGAVPIEEWNKTFGKVDINSASSVQRTLDGGYILPDQ